MIRRSDAIAAVLARAGDALVVTANGWISREASALHHRQPENVYMLGSMGLASSIGLGLALTNPDRRVLVLDGDGSLLLSLGALGMIAEQHPPNFVHVVLDGAGELDAVARAAGYAHVRRLDAVLDVDVIEEMLSAHGPVFLLINVAAAESDVARLRREPAATVAERFRRAV